MTIFFDIEFLSFKGVDCASAAFTWLAMRAGIGGRIQAAQRRLLTIHRNDRAQQVDLRLRLGHGQHEDDRDVELALGIAKLAERHRVREGRDADPGLKRVLEARVRDCRAQPGCWQPGGRRLLPRRWRLG